LCGQDVGKLFIMIILVVGIILNFFGINIAEWFTTN